MSSEKADDRDFFVACSDEEFCNEKVEWEPAPEDILRIYEQLDRNEIPELEWKCPGRRMPSPARDEFNQEDEESMESKPEEKSDDFDFMEDMSSPKLPVRRGALGGPKGSAKKKTTSLHEVLSNMRRHRKMEQLEKQAGTGPS